MNEGRRALLEAMRDRLIDRPILVFVDLAGSRRLGDVTWINDKTTWVKVMRGAKTYDIIKRHNTKHNVRFHAFRERGTNEIIHSIVRNEDDVDEAVEL